jgi:hypothetical protein
MRNNIVSAADTIVASFVEPEMLIEVGRAVSGNQPGNSWRAPSVALLIPAAVPLTSPSTPASNTSPSTFEAKIGDTGSDGYALL